MRINTTKELLLKGVQAVIGVIGSKNTLPILANILLETNTKQIKLTATDLDIGITTTIPVDVLEDGALTVPAKRLIDIIKELPEAGVELRVKKNNTIVVGCGDIVFKILGTPKDEFPKLPATTNKEEIILKQATLKNMLHMTTFAMSHDETRYVLNGVCFITTKQHIRAVATDGRRLALITSKNDNPQKIDVKTIIPAKTTQELIRLLGEDGDARITLSKNQAIFTIGETSVVSRLIEGDFPNYEQAIPKETDKKIKVKKGLLLSAIKRASLLVTPESQAVQFQIQKNKLTISKTTPEIGEVREVVEAEYGGEDLLVGFNPTYLMEAIKNINEEEIVMELTGPEKPAVIRVGDNYLYVVLPMQIG